MENTINIELTEEQPFIDLLDQLQTRSYREKFHECAKSWKMGAIFGSIVGVLLTFLFSGFQLDTVFFVMLPFTVLSGVMCLTTVFAMRYTSDFGLSRVPFALQRAATGVWNIFAGTMVTLAFALFLCGMILFAWLFGFMFFALFFPLETLYYWIRHRIEK